MIVLLKAYGVVNNVDASSTVVYVLVDHASEAYVPVIVCVIVTGVGTESFNLTVSVISLVCHGNKVL